MTAIHHLLQYVETERLIDNTVLTKKYAVKTLKTHYTKRHHNHITDVSKTSPCAT